MQILVATLRGAVHQQQRAAAYAALLPSLRQTRPQKNQIAAVTHTGEILTRCSHTVATRRSHLHVETACQ